MTPAPSALTALVPVNGKLIGVPSADGAHALLVFDPSANVWTTSQAQTPADTTFVGPAGLAEDGKVYIAQSSTTTSRMLIYDAATDTLTTDTSLGAVNPNYLGEYSTGAVLGGRLNLAVGVLAGDACSSAVYAFDPFAAAWTELDNAMAEAHCGGAGAAVGGKLYVAGGSSVDGVTESYFTPVAPAATPGPGTWTTMNTMPTPVQNAGGAVLKGKVYVAGGFTDAGATASTAVVQLYDPVANTWTSSTGSPTTVAPLLQAAGGTSLAELDGSLYLASTSGTSLWRYTPPTDPNSDTWADGAAINFTEGSGNYYDQSQAVDGKFYQVGFFAILDPRANSGAGQWTTFDQGYPGNAQQNWSSAVVGGKIYVMDGYAPGLSTAENEAYAFDPSTDTWGGALAQSNSVHNGGTAQAVNGLIYLIGGSTSGGTSGLNSSIEMYDPRNDGNGWTVKASVPSTARINTGSAVLDGKIYVAGGLAGGGGLSAALTVYDPATDTWTALHDMPMALAGPGVVALNGRVWIIGGDSQSNGGTGSGAVPNVWAYDPGTDTWTATEALHDLTQARAYHSAAVIDGQIYVTGGLFGSASKALTTEIYTP